MEAAVYFWPTSARIPAKAQESWQKFEGSKIKTLLVRISGTRLEMSYFGGFCLAAPEGRWNATFILPMQPSVKCGISAFGKGDWLPAVTPEVIQQYIAGLEIKGATDIRSTADETLTFNTMLLGARPEAVEYIMGKTQCTDYFVEVEGKIFIFSNEAPVSLFEIQRKTARLIFSRTVLL